MNGQGRIGKIIINSIESRTLRNTNQPDNFILGTVALFRWNLSGVFVGVCMCVWCVNGSVEPRNCVCVRWTCRQNKFKTPETLYYTECMWIVVISDADIWALVQKEQEKYTNTDKSYLFHFSVIATRRFVRMCVCVCALYGYVASIFKLNLSFHSRRTTKDPVQTNTRRELNVNWSVGSADVDDVHVLYTCYQ